MNGSSAIMAATEQPATAREQLLRGMPIRERRMHLSGVSTSILDGGSAPGPAVILLHGPGEFAAKWLRVIPGLIEHHHVIAPDLPDHGSSEVTEGRLNANRVITWLGQLIEHSCTTPPILVGHLLGGAIAARFAGEHPKALDRLVLIDTFGLRRLWPAPTFTLALMRFIIRPTERTYESFMHHCLADPDRVRQQMGSRWATLRAYSLDRARSPRVKRAMRVLMKQVGVPAIPPALLARIVVPTTLIWGRHDRAIRVRIAEGASARYGWPLHVIEGAADDAPTEQPDALVRALRPILLRPGALDRDP